MKHKITQKISYTLAVITGICAIAMFFYPTISDAVNKYIGLEIITEYIEQAVEKEEPIEIFKAAEEYNKKLYEHSNNNINEYALKFSELEGQKQVMGKVSNIDAYYESQLDILNYGMLGFLTIDKLNIKEPIYHYSDINTLSKGIGHLYGSSLPIGGESTHAVLTGHTGVMSAKLFTDLTKMEIGDKFSITVLNRKLNYEVDQINVILPSQMEYFNIEEGKDYVTLLTCTPYGVNTHRLLVRGHRIEDDKPEVQYIEVQKIKEYKKFPIVVFVLSVTVILIGIILIVIIWRKK